MKIQKGKYKAIEVTEKAYRVIYAPQGYKPVSSKSSKKKSSQKKSKKVTGEDDG